VKNRNYIWLICLIIIIAVVSVYFLRLPNNQNNNVTFSIDSVPTFNGDPYVVVNNNIPTFSEDSITDNSFEFYSELDELNRCGYALACVGVDIMPTEERGSIGQVKPTGWQTIKYDIVDGKYLYNRCHLIGYQLTGENANECNLITGTRYLNVEGMLPFENMVADYVKETGNHVMYRVTPVFLENDLVVRGVQIEALSVEDGGYGISFNVYVYNNQPGIEINYATGESTLTQNASGLDTTIKASYILNKRSKKFHLSACGQVKNIKDENISRYAGNREDLVADGYVPASCCNP